MFFLGKNDCDFSSDEIISSLKIYNELNDSDKLRLLLELNKTIGSEIKRLSLTNGVSYASLLKSTLEDIVLSEDSTLPPKGHWSPYKYRLYEELRKKLISKIGILGKTITRSRYLEAIETLKQMGYDVNGGL